MENEAKLEREPGSEGLSDGKNMEVREPPSGGQPLTAGIPASPDGQAATGFSIEGLKLELPDLLRPQEKSANSDSVLDELADDMLEVIKKINQIESRVSALGALVQYQQQMLEGGVASIVMEMNRLKENLLSDRKEFAMRSSLNAILPSLESLGYIEEMYRDDGDARPQKQCELIKNVLTGLIRTMGYREFESKVGSDFDPYTMASAGNEEGEPGKVLRVAWPGYLFGQSVVKPCGVILGKKKSSQNSDQPSSTTEAKERFHG